MFHGFDAERVAAMSEREIDELASDTRMIDNRRKLEAIVSNAGRMLELESEHGSFRDYLHSTAAAAWRGAFIERLKATGNVTLAALLQELTDHFPLEELATLLPEDADAITQTLALIDLDPEAPRKPRKPPA